MTLSYVNELWNYFTSTNDFFSALEILYKQPCSEIYNNLCVCVCARFCVYVGTFCKLIILFIRITFLQRKMQFFETCYVYF